MTLIIQKPTGAKLVMAQTYGGLDDPDAAVYIAAVEAADEAASPGVGALETATKVAIHSFVKGCKNDGIWPAIKASCILAGARTLAGALVPLVGSAPTNVNFVSGDYNRETGLGDASNTTKYLNSNRSASAQLQNSVHLAVYGTTIQTSATNMLIAALNAAATSRSTLFPTNATTLNAQLHISGNFSNTHSSLSTGFMGCNRSDSSQVQTRASGASITGSVSSVAPPSENYFVFARNFGGSPSQYSQSRLAFYSIGESLNLALLDARVTDLINAFAAAIP